jgi:CysZ protein
MDFLQQIKLAFQFYWRAFKFIDANNLWKMLIVPAVINLILAVLFIVFAVKTSRFIVEFVFENIRLNASDISVYSLIEGLMLVVIRAVVFFLYLKVYRYTVLLALAPLFVGISFKVNTIDSGQPVPSRAAEYLRESTGGIKIALRNFLIEVLISTLLIAVSMVLAWILPLVPIVILVLESYFTGNSLAYYRNAYFRLKSKENKKIINSYSGLIIGNGLCFNLLLLIPLLGFLFVPVLALVALGLSVNYAEKRKSVLWNSNQSTLITAES